MADMDPATVLVLRPDVDTKGGEIEPPADPVIPVEEEEGDSDTETTTPEIPPALDIEGDLPGEQYGVLTQRDNTQGEDTQVPSFTVDDQGRRRSTRERRAPTDYIPDSTNVRYNTVEGAANVNISEKPLRKFTEIDQWFTC
jgi:hypothetical protein